MIKATAGEATTPAVQPGQDPTRGQATRRRIRDEALGLFYRQGFRATTMREITSACGLTPAAFYNHFASKDELLFEIVEDAFWGLNEEVKSSIDMADAGTAAQLSALIRSMTLWHCAHLRQAKVANRETQELNEALAAKVRGHWNRLRSLIEEIIAAGMSTGEFQPPGKAGGATARILSTAIVGFPRSISGESLKSLNPEEHADMLETLVLWMVGVR
jgi:TetR/AcrR family transcriptional regulator, cholesterol catabolism regulator